MLPQQTLNICNIFTEVNGIMGRICIYDTIILKQRCFSNQLEYIVTSQKGDLV